MTDFCSLWSYDEIVRSGYIGEKQARILEIYTRAPITPYTATQIVKVMGRGVSENVRNRVTELEQMGFLKKHDVVECEFTHRPVNRWIYTGRRRPLEYKDEWATCDRCEGKGGYLKRVYFEGPRTIPGDLFK